MIVGLPWGWTARMRRYSMRGIWADEIKLAQISVMTDELLSCANNIYLPTVILSCSFSLQ